MKIESLDHLVLTVRNVETTCHFYSKVLGMEVVIFGNDRRALAFGSQKINLHQAGAEFAPHADHPTPGSADLCFITSTPLAAVLEHLRPFGIEIIEGPVKRTGATGDMMSIYFRDPDKNLIEVSEYCEESDKAPHHKVATVVPPPPGVPVKQIAESPVKNPEPRMVPPPPPLKAETKPAEEKPASSTLLPPPPGKP